MLHFRQRRVLVDFKSAEISKRGWNVGLKEREAIGILTLGTRLTNCHFDSLICGRILTGVFPDNIEFISF